MKRVFALVLALLLAASVLAGCGGSSAPVNEPAATEEPLPTDEPIPEATPEPTEEPVPEVQVEPMVVLDNENCSITVTGARMPSYEGGYFYVDVELVNKTGEALKFSPQTPGCSLNGIQADASMYTEVPAGETMESYVSVNRATGWGRDVDYGIDTYGYTDIALALKAQNSNYDDMGTAYFHVYPLGEENAVQIPFEANQDCQLLFDGEYLVAYSLSSDFDGRYYTMNFCFVNKMDVPVKLSFTASSGNFFDPGLFLNGTVGVKPFWSCSVMPGVWVFDDLVFGVDQLDEFEVEALTSLSGTIEIEDYEDSSIVYGYEDFQFTLE